MQKTTKIHMIGNAHIDPVWLWRWQEGFQEILATFRSALDRMRETDDFVFVASSAAFYAWVEEVDPAMFAEIQQRVAQGRWQLVGGWWVEPDCNIPCGESFVRHGLYGQRYFEEKFGHLTRVGYNVDSFGHAASLPQILSKSGLDYYIFMRPMPHEKKLPGRLFHWRADDGSQVLVFQVPFTYTFSGDDVKIHVLRCAEEIESPRDETMCFYGVGNHGGGPTRRAIESIQRLQADPHFPYDTPFSHPLAFFQSVEEKNWWLPTVQDELQHHASGCYAAHSGIKRWNRLAENRLQSAEKWSLTGSLISGLPYPRKALTHAWKNVLFNQFHDILAGTSLETAYQDARNTYGEAVAIADRAINTSLQSIICQIRIDPQEGMRPLVAFNPLTWDVKIPIELECEGWEEEACMVDDACEPVDFQAVRSETVTGRQRICFLAHLPALGYRTYRLQGRGFEAGIIPPSTADQSVDPVDSQTTFVIDNHHLESVQFKLDIDPKSGGIARLYDKINGVDIFSDLAARAVVIDDPSDTWSHGVFRFDRELGQFQAECIRLVETGPVKAVIRSDSTWGSSRLSLEFHLFTQLPVIELRINVDWRERLKALKLRFPVNVHTPTVSHEIAYSHIIRQPNGDEEPFQSWVDVTGVAAQSQQIYGFSLMNDGKHSLDVTGSDIGLTVLRSPAYAHHVPAELSSEREYAFIDQGVQTFTCWLLPHQLGWQDAGTVKHSLELNQLPQALWTTYHPQGNLPQSASFINVEPDNVLVSVFKLAEDNDDWILRAYETAKKSAQATIDIPHLGRKFSADFAPGEIKTFRIPKEIQLPVVETNMLEKNL